MTTVVLVSLLAVALVGGFAVSALKGKWKLAIVGLILSPGLVGLAILVAGALMPAKVGSTWWRKVSLRDGASN